MNEILRTVLSLSISGSLLALVLFVLKPVVKHRLSKTWQYYIWLVVLMRFLIPFTPEGSLIGTLFQRMETPSSPQTAVVENVETIGQIDDPNIADGLTTLPAETTANTASANSGIDFQDAVWVIWLVVAVALFVRKVTNYHNFGRYVRAGAESVEEPMLLAVYQQVCAEKGVRQPPVLLVNPMVASPMMTGILRPAILLPDANLSERAALDIFLHELTHYRRMDVVYKWTAQIVICLHWFNPAAYLVAWEIGRGCEFSCDEAVILQHNEEERLGYGDTLVASLRMGKDYGNGVASITLHEDAKLLKERLNAIMKYGKKSGLALVMSIFLTVTLVWGGLVTGAYAAGDNSASVNITRLDESAIIPPMDAIVLIRNEHPGDYWAGKLSSDFAFTLDKKADIIIALEWAATKGTFQLYLNNANGQSVYSKSYSEKSVREAHSISLSPGTYSGRLVATNAQNATHSLVAYTTTPGAAQPMPEEPDKEEKELPAIEGESLPSIPPLAPMGPTAPSAIQGSGPSRELNQQYYDNDDAIAEEITSAFFQYHLGEKYEATSYLAEGSGFVGCSPLYWFELEKSADLDIALRTKVTAGRLKLVLVGPDGAVTNLWDSETASGNVANVKVSLQKGKSALKIVGADAEYSLGMGLTGEQALAGIQLID